MRVTKGAEYGPVYARDISVGDAFKLKDGNGVYLKTFKGAVILASEIRVGELVSQDLSGENDSTNWVLGKEVAKVYNVTISLQEKK